MLSLAGEVAVGEVVAVKALVSTTVGSIKDGEGEAWESSEMDFVRGKARGRADRVVVKVFDVGQVYVPFVLVIVADHGEHLVPWCALPVRFHRFRQGGRRWW